MTKIDDAHGSNEKRTSSKDKGRDPQCVFSSGVYRCPLPATWYPENAPIGPHQHYNRRGYCAMHNEEEKRNMEPWEAQAQLARFKEHAKIIYDELREETWAAERERMIQAKIDEHPEWQRQDGESSSEYQRRMMATCKGMGWRV